MVQIVLEIMERGKLNINRKFKKNRKISVVPREMEKSFFSPKRLNGGEGALLYNG